ncbi:hypothetical protein OHA04_23545 [Streptomyces sp. NBC_01590]|uniref:hypothetical protein n=1 Tax=Streptomyces sp. NBC_01590 TaxID=2975887 RepID=UPI00386AB25E
MTAHDPHAAGQAPPRAAGGAEIAARKGVLAAVRPDPHTATAPGIRPGLHIRGLERGGFPVADWLCACGHHERARGRRAVTELTSRMHVGQCPHRTSHPIQAERRTAA